VLRTSFKTIGTPGFIVVMVVAILSPAAARGAPEDVASTHAYVAAAYTALHATVTTWSSVEASIHRLDQRFEAQCPHVGAGSPQSEEEQKLSYEVAGALWATGYHTDAKIVDRFVKAIAPLHWSNPVVDRAAHKLTAGLRAMVALQVPDLCSDVRAWAAGGYNAVPASTAAYARHVEAIEVKEIPRRLLVRYAQPSDRGLIARTERLATRFEELEFQRGQVQWDRLLEVLSLNQ
jgi:hypothetical protein